MSSAAVTNEVIARDNFGRFISEIEAGGEQMMRAMMEDGIELSRAMAPKGAKDDPRTPKLVDSIDGTYSGTRASWWADARHALAQELGAVPHEITGWVNFFWEREGRDWDPGPNRINHPGNAPQPYLRPAYEMVMGRWMEYARRFFPG